MTQSKSRRLLYQQARLIRIQWAVILALVCTIVLMAIFLPKAKAIEETATPTLELEPASYVTPEIMPEPMSSLLRRCSIRFRPALTAWTFLIRSQK